MKYKLIETPKNIKIPKWNNYPQCHPCCFSKKEEQGLCSKPRDFVEVRKCWKYPQSHYIIENPILSVNIKII
jgi:hypothetical protein